MTRAVALRKGTNGWMTSLLDRLPMSAAEANDAQASSYLEALSDALADGRIIGDEARELARIAGAAGLGAAQVVALNDQLLDSIYQAAIEDEVLTKTEIRDLVKAAVALGRPDKFSHLTPTTPNGSSQKTQSETSTGRAGALSNESSRADRFHRALTAVEYQRSGESRENIAVSLGVSLATVKQLLRDGKWYLDPNSDGPRLALATAAADARNQGETQSAFQASQALSKGKTAEVWRDAAFLLGRDLTGMGGGSTAPGSGSRVTATGPTPSQR